MRMKSIQAIFALLGLGSLGVLGSSTNLAKNFFESVKSSLATEVFFSEYEKESKKNSLAMPPDNDISGNESIEDTASTSTEIPEYILYDRMFSLIEKFREMAEKQASRGEEITAFQGYFEREADLNEWQVKILQDTSVEYVNAVRIVDSQAEIVIEQLRLQHPIGSMPDGGELIKPSSELLQLQEQRNKLALYYRDQLSVLLGIDKFDELNKFVLGPFASGFQALPVPSVADGTNKGGQQ